MDNRVLSERKIEGGSQSRRVLTEMVGNRRRRLSEVCRWCWEGVEV